MKYSYIYWSLLNWRRLFAFVQYYWHNWIPRSFKQKRISVSQPVLMDNLVIQAKFKRKPTEKFFRYWYLIEIQGVFTCRVLLQWLDLKGIPDLDNKSTNERAARKVAINTFPFEIIIMIEIINQQRKWW